jgi:hypothetical protein
MNDLRERRFEVAQELAQSLIDSLYKLTQSHEAMKRAKPPLLWERIWSLMSAAN